MGIPEERIDRLLTLAREAVVEGEPDRSREYVHLARRISERHRTGLPREFARKTCDDCDVYLRPGVTARVRTQPGHVVVRCLSCGATHRYPFGDSEGEESDATSGA
ncbi:ribonuclease P protein component 4 [Haloparvum sp. AD34]